jgi:hypothetical protein
VRANKGAAGVDEQTLSMVERQGVEAFLAELQGLLRLLGTIRYPEARACRT